MLTRLVGCVVVGLLTGAPAGSVAGCSDVCTGAELAPAPATEAADGALVFEARMTSGGEPVAGATVTFFSRTERDNGTGGHRIGESVTDADGVARLEREQGRAGMAVAGAEVIGYQVRYAKLDRVEGVRYCKTQADGTVEAL